MAADLEKELAFARRVGELAGEIALRFFGTDVRTELKADDSPVTEADIAAERAILEALADEWPSDGVLSEESGAAGPAGAARRWLIDPIDGTKWFLAGDNAWGTHIALEVDGEIVVGVITRPAENRSWWAAKSHGAWSSSGRRLEVSSTASLNGARVGGYVRDASAWQAGVSKHSEWVVSPSPILDLVEGRLDAVLSEGGFEWDHAPAVVLLHEAGGRLVH